MQFAIDAKARSDQTERLSWSVILPLQPRPRVGRSRGFQAARQLVRRRLDICCAIDWKVEIRLLPSAAKYAMFVDVAHC